MQDGGGFQWVEFFAGKAEATRMFSYGGYRAGKLDLMYMEARDEGHQNPMDLTSDAGMGWFAGKKLDSYSWLWLHSLTHH